MKRFAWGVLAYNLLVIAWGAFVRATGSGAGCGRHWPLCNGEVVPRPKSIETIIEATHRGTSGIAMILVFALAVMVFRRVPRHHPARRFAALSAFFMAGEAILGAGLVLFELVAHDASLKRAFSMILHLGNTFLLLASLTLTAWAIGRPPADEPARASAPTPPLPRAGLVKGLLGVSFASVLVLASSGAIAALGDTLFPARSLAEGFAQDLSPVAHVFLRLRMLHPFLAVMVALVVITTATVARALRPTLPRVQTTSKVVTLLFVAQLGAGLVNVTLLAPVWMQLVHLLLGDATWIALVLLAAEAQMPIMSRKGPAPTSDVPPSTSNVAPVTYAPAGETR